MWTLISGEEATEAIGIVADIKREGGWYWIHTYLLLPTSLSNSLNNHLDLSNSHPEALCYSTHTSEGFYVGNSLPNKTRGNT